MNYKDHNATNARIDSFFDSALALTSTQAFLYILVTFVCLLFADIPRQINTFLAFAQRTSRLPSGPWGLPLLGSFLFLNASPERTLDRWASKYGALYSLRLGKQLFVIISSPGVAKDLMITNGSVFSGRPESFVRNQMVFAGRGVTATPYNDRWRKHRRLANIWLNQRAVEQYAKVIDFEATDMIKELYTDSKDGTVPINPHPYAGRCTLNNMTTITFGMRTDSIHHPLVRQALKLSREFMKISGPMSNLVDFMPHSIQKLLPWTMKRRGKQLHRDLVDTYGGFIQDIDRDMKAGTEVENCLAKNLLSVRDQENLDHLDIAMLASAFMIGGVETTASILQWFTALIPTYPEIQHKAQEELDRVVGRGRLPTVEDEANLPYCHAIIKEVERCYQPVWLGTPHATSKDFEYEGKFIPRGTTVVLNTWTMHHDPNRWEKPAQFNPDRYINDKHLSSYSANLPDPNSRDHWMFGAGRRICPGILVAEREIWLVISRLLWAFNMEEIEGHRIDLNAYDGKSGRSPAPFLVRLKPRFKGVDQVLESEK